MELKALLLLDNVPGHDPELAFPLTAKFSFMIVKFLPPNTTSLIQPADQQVTANFKWLYTKKVFHKCHEATSGDNGITLKEFWKTKFKHSGGCIQHCGSITRSFSALLECWMETSLANNLTRF
jgi:hypothetical protein